MLALINPPFKSTFRNPPLEKVEPNSIFLFNYTIILDKDYKILFTQTGEQKTVNHGGNNKQTILLNIDIFSLFL
jgi:hypothetical protein